MKQKENTAKKKALPKFGLFDVFIILLVIVTIVCICFRYDMVDFFNTKRNAEQYTVTYSIKNIRYTTPGYVEIGDTFCFANGDVLGTVISESDEMSNIALNVTPASELLMVGGQPTEVFYPNNETRVDAKGRLSCRGTTTENGSVLINGSTYIAPGQKIAIQTEKVSVTIQILNVEKTS